MVILCVCVSILSCVLLFVTLWTAAHQALLSMGFPRQEYWSRLPFPSCGDLPHPGIELASPASLAVAGGFFARAPPGKASYLMWFVSNPRKGITVAFIIIIITFIIVIIPVL